MDRKFVNPTELYDPRFFSHAVTVGGLYRLVEVSGQVSYDRDGFVIGKGDMREQCEQVFRSLSNILRASGASWGDVIKMTAYMVGMNPESVNLYRELRARYVDPRRMPASTLIGVERLVHEHLLIEVELVAAVPEQSVARKTKKPPVRKANGKPATATAAKAARKH